MQSFPYVPDVQLTNVNRTPALDADGKPVQPMTHLQFLIGRLSDTGLTQGMEPIKASRFAIKLYDEIEAQADVAKARGHWVFEDDRANALKRIILSPTVGPTGGGYIPQILHCLLPFLESAEQMKPWKDAAVEAKIQNGAEKALPEVAQAS